MMQARTLIAILLVLNAITLVIVWEQPACAASMECHGETTIGEALKSIATQYIDMQVVIGIENTAKEQTLNHVSDIEHSPAKGITVHFEGPDGTRYGSDTFRNGGREFVKSVSREDHEV